MVELNQVKAGLEAYINEEIIAKLPGWKKWVFGAGASMFLANAEKTVQSLAENKMVKMLGIIAPDGKLDIETAYREISKQAETTGPITIDIPAIGALKFAKSDIDRLYQLIMG